MASLPAALRPATPPPPKLEQDEVGPRRRVAGEDRKVAHPVVHEVEALALRAAPRT